MIKGHAARQGKKAHYQEVKVPCSEGVARYCQMSLADQKIAAV
jgi:hypothetical protein